LPNQLQTYLSLTDNIHLEQYAPQIRAHFSPVAILMSAACNPAIQLRELISVLSRVFANQLGPAYSPVRPWRITEPQEVHAPWKEAGQSQACICPPFGNLLPGIFPVSKPSRRRGSHAAVTRNTRAVPRKKKQIQKQQPNKKLCGEASGRSCGPGKGLLTKV